MVSVPLISRINKLVYFPLHRHIQTAGLPSGVIQRSGQNSSPSIMQMNMTLTDLGSRSHQHPDAALLCISDCVKSCFPIISTRWMDSILL